mmetsp:Transcript_17720/g.27566  ORF Transcript_17720/g.27566 Transcript_17720/m.27566 type:complete len:120 (-) Transcript_17720:204-563(-)
MITSDRSFKKLAKTNQSIKMCSDLGQGSRCCAIYSFTGILFTLYVGVLLSKQPFLLSGIDNDDDAKSSAFGAMGMFILTFGLSIYGIYHDAQQKREEIDNPENYQLNSGNVPAYGSRFD